MQNKLLTVDDDGVSGIVPPGIAGDDGEVLREYVDDFALTLVAPLRADDHRSLAVLQFQLRKEDFAQTRASPRQPRGRTHPCPQKYSAKLITRDKGEEVVYTLS